MSVPRLTREQAAIVGAFTGILAGPMKDLHAYAERKLGHPIHSACLPHLEEEIYEASRLDFFAICAMPEEQPKECGPANPGGAR